MAMSSAIEELVKLRAENKNLRAEVSYLKELLQPGDGRFECLGLSPNEQRLVAFMFDRSPDRPSFQALYYVGRMESAANPYNQLKVYICKIRRKLAPYKVQILTQYGWGHWIGAENKARLAVLIERGSRQ